MVLRIGKKYNMTRDEHIRMLFSKYVSSEEERKSYLDDILDYGEEENPFRNLCEIITQESIKVSEEDKKLIDEIGESLWTGGAYGPERMESRYWKNIVE